VYAAPTLVDPSTLLVTIGGGVMCLNATLAPNVQRLVWVTYVNPNPYAGANFNYLPPVPTQYGVAIVASSDVLSAVTYNNGSVAWSYALDCSAITVEGQVAIAVCGELVAIDVVTGTFLGQIGVQIINRGLLTVPNPSNPLLPTVIFETDISNYYSTVTITTFRNVTAVVPQQATPLPPISPNATLPPGFTPEVPAPSQQPPSVLAYQYFPSAPNSVLDWQWPSAADPNTTAHSRTNLLLSPNLLVALDSTNNTLLAFNPVTYQALWQTPVPMCQQLQYFSDIGANLVAFECQSVVYFIDTRIGMLVGNNSDATLTNAINNGDVESPLAAAPGMFCYTYYVYGYVASANQYQYTYGAFCAGLETTWVYNCPSAAETSISAVAYNGNVLMVCSGLAPVYVSGSTGASLVNLSGTNFTNVVQTFTSPSGRYVAFLASTNWSATQLTILDNQVMAPIAIYNLSGVDLAGSFQATAMSDSSNGALSLAILTANDNMTVWQLPLNVGLTGVQAAPLWSVYIDIQNDPSLYLDPAITLVTTYPLLSAWRTSDGAFLYSVVTGVNQPTISAVGPYAVTWSSNGVAAVTSNGQPLLSELTVEVGSVGLAPSLQNRSATCLLVSSTGDDTFRCYSTKVRGWADLAFNYPAANTVSPTVMVVADDNRVVASSVYDLTFIDSSSGATMKTTTLSPNAVGSPVRFGPSLFLSFTERNVWVLDATTGLLNGVVDLPLCNGGLAQPDTTSATTIGSTLYVAGTTGCIFAVMAAGGSSVSVSLFASTTTEVLLLPGTTALLWVDGRGVLYSANLTGSVNWMHTLEDVVLTSRTAVEYGRFIYATSSSHSIHVVDKYTGAFVKSVVADGYTLLGPLVAYNGAIWAPAASHLLRFSADPTAATALQAAILTNTNLPPTVSNVVMHAFPTVSLSGIIFYTTSAISVAVDTTTNTVLWNGTARAISRSQTAFFTTYVLDGDVLYGDVGQGFAVTNLRTGAVSLALGTTSITSLFVSPTAIYFSSGNSLTRVAKPAPPATLPPQVTVAAPTNAASSTVAPFTPAPLLPPGQQYPSLGCLNRVQIKTAGFQNCVSGNVLAPAYTTRTAAGLFDCGAAAPAMSGCIDDYVRAMAADCTPGLQYLSTVLSSLRTASSSASLPFCSTPSTCVSAAGSAAFCAVLVLPPSASVMPGQQLPQGFTGLPTLPSFSTPAPTPAAPTPAPTPAPTSAPTPAPTPASTPAPTPTPASTPAPTPAPTSDPRLPHRPSPDGCPDSCADSRADTCTACVRDTDPCPTSVLRDRADVHGRRDGAHPERPRGQAASAAEPHERTGHRRTGPQRRRSSGVRVHGYESRCTGRATVAAASQDSAEHAGRERGGAEGPASIAGSGRRP
jgi:hypothetical protein